MNTTELPDRIKSPLPQYGINYCDFAGSRKVNSKEELVEILSKTQGTRAGGFAYIWSSGEVIYGWDNQEEAWIAEAGKRKWSEASGVKQIPR